MKVLVTKGEIFELQIIQQSSQRKKTERNIEFTKLYPKSFIREAEVVNHLDYRFSEIH